MQTPFCYFSQMATPLLRALKKNALQESPIILKRKYIYIFFFCRAGHFDYTRVCRTLKRKQVLFPEIETFLYFIHRLFGKEPKCYMHTACILMLSFYGIAFQAKINPQQYTCTPASCKLNYVSNK